MKMKWFHFKRLLKLAAFLDNLPEQKFDFSVVVAQGIHPMLDALEAGAHRCDTVACAMGWMPAVFPRDIAWGAFWNRPNGHPVPLSGRVADERVDFIMLRIAPRTVLDFDAAAVYFGINGEDAEYLFQPGAGNGLTVLAKPKAVANHIRKFVAQRQAEQAADRPKKRRVA